MTPIFVTALSIFAGVPPFRAACRQIRAVKMARSGFDAIAPGGNDVSVFGTFVSARGQTFRGGTDAPARPQRQPPLDSQGA
jgi:hypothetical protein